MFIEDESFELLEEYRKRLDDYLKKTLTTRQILAKEMGITTMTLDRILKGKSVKPCTLIKVRDFLRKEEC